MPVVPVPRELEERAYDRALLLAAEGQHLWDSAETAAIC